MQKVDDIFSSNPQNTGLHCNYQCTKHFTTFPGASALKTFHFFEGALVFVEGGGAPVPWYNHTIANPSLSLQKLKASLYRTVRTMFR